MGGWAEIARTKKEPTSYWLKKLYLNKIFFVYIKNYICIYIYIYKYIPKMEKHKINKLFFVQVLLLSVLRLLLHLSAFFVVCIFTFNFNIAMSPKKCIYTKIFLDMYIYLYV